jgi:hypothetical protein
MISFRDEEPTYAQAAEAASEYLEELDEDGDCRACGNSEDDCNRYHRWCLGRTARLSKSNSAGWREQFVEQLRLVISRHGYWPKSAGR